MARERSSLYLALLIGVSFSSRPSSSPALHCIRMCAVIRNYTLPTQPPGRSNSGLRVLGRRALFRAHRRRVGDRLSGRRSVAAHVGIGLAGQHHRHSSVVQDRSGHRQDIVLPVVHGLHQSSSAGADLLRRSSSARTCAQKTVRAERDGAQKLASFAAVTPSDMPAACSRSAQTVPSRRIACMMMASFQAIVDRILVATFGDLPAPASQSRLVLAAGQHGARSFAERFGSPDRRPR